MARLFIASIFVFSCAIPAFAQDSNPTSLTAKQCKLNGKERIVPNILGFDPQEAQKIIEACDFVYDGATDVHTLSYEAIGTVGDQEPSGGTVAKAGTTVRGFVSKGLYPPDFTGKSTAWNVDDAERYYRDFRHGVKRVEENSSEPYGTVIKQHPFNGELYNSGLPLVLTYSIGLAAIDEIELISKGVFGMGSRTFAKNTNESKKIHLTYRMVTDFQMSDQPDNVDEIEVTINPASEVDLGVDTYYAPNGEIDIFVDFSKIKAQYVD